MPPPGTFTKKITSDETGEIIEYIYDAPTETLPGAVMEVVMHVGGSSEADVYLKGDLPFHIEIEQPGTVLHEQPMLRLVDGIRMEVEVVFNTFAPTLSLHG